MTTNQLQYMRLTEDARANRAKEELQRMSLNVDTANLEVRQAAQALAERQDIRQELLDYVKAAAQARASGDYETAFAIRDYLDELGYAGDRGALYEVLADFLSTFGNLIPGVF